MLVFLMLKINIIWSIEIMKKSENSKNEKRDQKTWLLDVRSCFDDRKSLDDQIESLLREAFQLYLNDNNTTWISLLLNEALKKNRIRSAEHAQLRGYTRKHMHVKIQVKNDLKTYAVKAGKTKGKRHHEVKMPAAKLRWYDHGATTQAVTNFDVIKLAKALRGKYNKAVKDDKVTVQNKAQSIALLKAIDSAVSKALVTAK